MNGFSRTLGQLDGDVQAQINQILDQLRRVQEETEDMVRTLSEQVRSLGEKINQTTEVK